MNPLATQDEIRYICEDLLSKRHPCLDRKIVQSPFYYSMWNDNWAIKRNLLQLLRDNLNLPEYLLEKILLRFPDLIKEEGYAKEQWFSLYCILLLQENIPSKALLEQIVYIAKNVESKDSRFGSSYGYTREELLENGIKNNKLSPEDLTRLCGNSDSYVRYLASKNPSCPAAGKVVISLMGGEL